MLRTILGWPRDNTSNAHKKVADKTYVTMLTDSELNNHPIALVAHLEPATKLPKDPYQRPRMNHPGPVEPEKEIIDTRDHYIFEKLFGKQVQQGWTQYLMQWLGYGLEHNVCYNTQDLEATTGLISNYKKSHPMVFSNTQLKTTAQARCGAATTGKHGQRFKPF